MKKLNSTGRGFVMSVSLCLAFMFLGASAVSAQNWVTPDEAYPLLKNEMLSLEQAAQNAPTTEAALEFAFLHKYYKTILTDLSAGTEVPAAVLNNRPENKPTLHASGLIAFSSDDENFKEDAQEAVDAATALLTN